MNAQNINKPSNSYNKNLQDTMRHLFKPHEYLEIFLQLGSLVTVELSP
jgi:hypothetical protein